MTRSAARRYLSTPFQINVECHITGNPAGNRHRVDAVSKLVYNPKVITVGHLPYSEKRPSEHAPKMSSSSAAMMIQNQFRSFQVGSVCSLVWQLSHMYAYCVAVWQLVRRCTVRQARQYSELKRERKQQLMSVLLFMTRRGAHCPAAAAADGH